MQLPQLRQVQKWSSGFSWKKAFLLLPLIDVTVVEFKWRLMTFEWLTLVYILEKTPFFKKCFGFDWWKFQESSALYYVREREKAYLLHLIWETSSCQVLLGSRYDLCRLTTPSPRWPFLRPYLQIEDHSHHFQESQPKVPFHECNAKSITSRANTQCLNDKLFLAIKKETLEKKATKQTWFATAHCKLSNHLAAFSHRYDKAFQLNW